MKKIPFQKTLLTALLMPLWTSALAADLVFSGGFNPISAAALPAPPDATFITGAGTTVEINNNTGGYVNVLSSIYNDSILNINNGDAIGLGDISGSGRLTKSGSGFLIVNGAWTYSGTTTVVGGSLGTSLGTINSTGRLEMVGGTFTNNSNNHFGSLEGTGGTIDINFGTLTVGGDNSSTTFAGTLTGLSLDGLTKTGTGTLILTQVPGHFGTTTISGGALQIGNGTAVSGGMASHIVNNAALIVDTSGNIFLNSLGGNGDLIKNGTGTLIFSAGVPAYTGTTTINAGTLQIGNGGTIVGGVMGTIVNNGALEFSYDIGGGGTTIGSLSGTGSLTKSGTGNLVAGGGAWTHSGDTTVNGGNLAASITSTGRLNMNGGTFDTGGSTFGSLAGSGGTVNINGGTLTVGGDNSSTSYAGTLGGNGDLIRNGTGTLTLTGVNTHTGTVQLNGGTTVINGNTAAAVAVNAGALLGGSGTINNTLTANAGGIVAPGNSIGTLTVNGSLTFAAGSIYRVEADAAGASDRINVIGAPGTATIGGGTVDVQAGAGTYNPATTYTIVNATGGVTGTFTTVTSNLAFLTPSLSYDPNNVFLTLTRNAVTFQSVAITPNQIAISNMLDPLVAGAPGGDLGVVLNAVTGLSAVQARAAYEAIGGASIVELRRANVAFTRGFSETLDARIRQPVAARVALAGPVTPLSAEQERGFWIKAGAQGYKADGDGNAYGSEVRGGSISFGIDTAPSRDVVVGLAGSYGKSDLDFDGITDKGKTRNLAIGAYGQYASGPWTFKGVAAFAFGNNEINRNVSFGAISRVASGEFDSRSATLYGEAAYDIPMKTYRLRPLAGLSWTHARQDGYSETGAGALNLNVAGENTDSVRSLIGVKTLHSSGNLRIEPRLVWSHEFGDLNTPLQAQLSGAGAAGNFTVSGVRLERDMLTAGLTLAGNVAKGTELFVDLQVDGNSRQTAYAAYAGVRVRW